MSSLYSSMFVAGMALGLLMIGALATQVRKQKANFHLIPVLAGMLFHQFLAYHRLGDAMLVSPAVHRLGLAITLFMAPNLYFYTLCLTGRESLIRRPLLHFVPFFFAVCWYLLWVTVAMVNNDWPSLVVTPAERIARGLIAISILGYYCALSLRELKNFQTTHLREYYSENLRPKLTWLRFLILALTVLLAAAALELFFFPHLPYVRIFAPLSTLAVGGLAIYALKFSPVIAAVNHTAAPRQLLDDSVLKQKRSELIRFFDGDKPFLNPQLTLNDLATSLEIKPYLMSEVINRGFGLSFYEMVNRARVEEAKRRLVDPKYQHLSILGVAMDSGFNSKSAFNEFFKKSTGMTPSEFREKSHNA